MTGSHMRVRIYLTVFLVLAMFTVGFAASPLFVGPAHAYVDEEDPGRSKELPPKVIDPNDPKIIALKKDAAASLLRVRNSIKKNGFFCANIELNIWKSLAERSGTFDEKIYHEFKTELYTSSMTHMDRWFNYYIKKGYYNDAQKCLQTWRLHAMTIDSFDEALYAEKNAALEAIKEK